MEGGNCGKDLRSVVSGEADAVNAAVREGIGSEIEDCHCVGFAGSYEGVDVWEIPRLNLV